MPRKREDLTGRKFGKLTVLGYDHTDSKGETWWLCKCDCGNPRLPIIRRQSLRQGTTSSCGCLIHEVRDDLTGQRFGRLTVIEFAGRDMQRKSRWRCVCDCGTETIVDAYNLKVGHIKSCGCRNRERIGNLNRSHGLRGDPLYPVWRGMKARCNNPNEPAFKNYGGRGIKVCDEWERDFQAFYDWAIENGYNRELSIDRIDNDDGYRPDNCRWVTALEQSNNRRSCYHITYAGETHTISEWSRILGIRYDTLRRRVHNNDMRDFEDYFEFMREGEHYE